MSCKDPLSLVEKTRWRKKYGGKLTFEKRDTDGDIDTKDHDTNRSIWSPIDTRFPVGGTTEEQNDKLHYDQAREKYQREDFFGYSTRELVDLDCISERKLSPLDYKGPVQPFLDYDHWEKENKLCLDFPKHSLYPIAENDPSMGLWAASNPSVWLNLRPSLILASRIMASAHTLTFIKSLFTNELERIPNERIRPEDIATFQSKDDPRLFRIPFGDNIRRSKDKQVEDRMKEIFQVLNERLNFGLMKEDEDPMLGTKGPVVDGMTHSYQHRRLAERIGKGLRDPACTRFWIWISFVPLAALLRNDLNDGERYAIHWQLALTIVHELMHTIWIVHSFIQDQTKYIHEHFSDLWSHEPFYGNSPIAELGYQFEVEVFGACEQEFPISPPVGMSPLGYWYIVGYPTVHDDLKAPNTSLLISPKLAEYQIRFPIPISYYEGIFNEDFWNTVVWPLGVGGMLHAKNLKDGVRTIFKKHNGMGSDQWDECVDGRIFNRENDPLADFDMLLTNEKRLASLEPTQRDALIYMGKMVETATLRNNFSEGMRALQEAADKVLKTSNSDQTAKFFRGIINPLLAAASAHYDCVRNFQIMEVSTSSKRPEWKNNLLVWNHGMQTFVRSTGDSLDKRPILRQKLANVQDRFNQILMHLEASRMNILYEGPHSCVDGDDGWEISRIRQAIQSAENGNWNDVNRVLNEFHHRGQEFRLTPYATSIQDTFAGCYSQLYSKSERLDFLNKSLSSLTGIQDALKNLERFPQLWMNNLIANINFARMRIASTLAEPDPPQNANPDSDLSDMDVDMDISSASNKSKRGFVSDAEEGLSKRKR